MSYPKAYPGQKIEQISTDLGQTQARFYSTYKTYTAWFCTSPSTKKWQYYGRPKTLVRFVGSKYMV